MKERDAIKLHVAAAGQRGGKGGRHQRHRAGIGPMRIDATVQPHHICLIQRMPDGQLQGFAFRAAGAARRLVLVEPCRIACLGTVLGEGELPICQGIVAGTLERDAIEGKIKSGLAGRYAPGGSCRAGFPARGGRQTGLRGRTGAHGHQQQPVGSRARPAHRDGGAAQRVQPVVGQGSRLLQQCQTGGVFGRWVHE